MPNVPDLSVKGWITSPLEKADKLLAHFYAAEFSQSNLFPEDVHSFTYILQKNLNNQKGLEVDLVDSLTRYFNKYFINATATATVTDDVGSASKQTVTITMTFETPDGKKFDLSDVVAVKGSLFERYTHLNNTGVLRDTEDVE